MTDERSLQAKVETLALAVMDADVGSEILSVWPDTFLLSAARRLLLDLLRYDPRMMIDSLSPTRMMVGGVLVRFTVVPVTSGREFESVVIDEGTSNG